MTPKLGSLFGGLFSAGQTAKDKEEYQRALEKAAREVAAWNDAEAGNELIFKQKEKGWIN
jgi:hypothetical protein